MAALTLVSPPSTAAVSRRPFFTRWWYDPVQRRRVIIATVLALLYGSGLAYGSWARGGAAQRCPSTTPDRPPTRAKVPPPTTQGYAPRGPPITQLGHERPTPPPP